MDDRGRVGQAGGKKNGGEDQQVFGPLLWPEETDDRR